MTDCAAPRHDEDDPVPAAEHAWLCRGCTAGLRADLRQLPQLYAALEELLDPRRASDTGGGDGGGLPVNVAAVECRAQAEHDLRWWVPVVASWRRLPVPVDVRVAAMCGWLCGQIRWAALVEPRGEISREPIGVMAGAFRDDRARARAVIAPRPVTRFPVPGDCPKCGTRSLQATLYRDPRDAEWTAVTCTNCGHGWDSWQLNRLSRQLTEGAAA